MISEEDFTGLIACALEMLPMMRQLSTTTLAMIYVQLPRKTIEELNSVLLQYAIKQWTWIQQIIWLFTCNYLDIYILLKIMR